MMYQCPICGKEVPTRKGLAGHRAWKHGKRPKGGPGPGVMREGLRLSKANARLYDRALACIRALKEKPGVLTDLEELEHRLVALAEYKPKKPSKPIAKPKEPEPKPFRLENLLGL